MEILRGYSHEGDRSTGGWILDPENGKEYSRALWREGSDRLRLRGYRGPFYRTQTWRRPKAVVHEKLARHGRGRTGQPPVKRNSIVRYLPLLGHVIPTLAIGYGWVIPRSCIAGCNELTIGFGLSVIGTCLAYAVDQRTASRVLKGSCDAPT
jgi:hypothetical protein